MKQIAIAKGETPEQFVENYNEICSNLKFVENTELISSTMAYIFYEKEEPSACVRRCAECSNYDWGRGCAFRAGVIRPMDEACEYLNVEVPNEEVQN